MRRVHTHPTPTAQTPAANLAASLAVAVLLALAGLAGPRAVAAQSAESDEAGLPSIEEKTQGMEKLDGFMPVYWDEDAGKVWLEVGRFGEEILHYTALSAGVGSNDIGLDRGQLGPRHVVEFRRFGPKVLMVEPNYSYRADETDNPAERRAVEEAFAESVLWGFQAAAETGDRVLVDATDYLLRDAHGVVQTLRRTNQGSYSLDKGRSAPYRPRTKVFPENTEIEVTLTYTGNAQGGWIRSVTPTAQAVTIRQHYSFVQLPELGSYEPREGDPRGGFFGINYLDYSTPLGEPMRRWYISRHRLEKVDPTAEVSDAVEPIVYYLDRGTPEPVRSALLDGARWWAQAFEAAGYRNAYRVEMMPEDADPLDVRYNVIQWVHRSTRGWSYGSSVTDPRTGEILKGHVSLGSLRVRQDYLIAEGLLSPYDGDAASDDMRDMALARIRQLSAHEVGHTLGLAHNYISSMQGPEGRASVMDYPHPLVTLDGDRRDMSRAYDTGIGEWDAVAVTFGYQDFPEGTDEKAALTEILMEAEENGITFISDQDARPAGSAHPRVHLWDNGMNAARELDRKMQVRAAALEDFGAGAIQSGEPMALMEEALVPLYLHHRYQVEAAAKVVGGLYYTYALKGDGQEPLRPVPPDEQREALDALLGTLEPGALTLPESVLDALPPRPYGYGPHRELFPRHTGVVFDALSPAEVAADMTVSMILNPQRAARLVQQHARDESLPGFQEVLHPLLDQAFRAEVDGAYEAEVNRVVQRVVVTRLRDLAARATLPQVRAIASHTLATLKDAMEDEWAEEADRDDRAHFYLLAQDIDRFLDRDMEPIQERGILDAPPGSPIGSGQRGGLTPGADAPWGGSGVSGAAGYGWGADGGYAPDLDGVRGLLPWDAFRARTEPVPGWAAYGQGILYCSW